jgi:hypothetical protein
VSETTYTPAPVCPYCGHVEKDAWEISEHANEHDCNACGETMFIDRHVSVSYSTGPKAKVGGKLGFVQAVTEYGDSWLSHFNSLPSYRGLSAATICSLREWRPGLSTTDTHFDSGVMVMAEEHGRSWQVKADDVREGELIATALAHAEPCTPDSPITPGR